jgi:hypothetical protein
MCIFLGWFAAWSMLEKRINRLIFMAGVFFKLGKLKGEGSNNFKIKEKEDGKKEKKR